MKVGALAALLVLGGGAAVGLRSAGSAGSADSAGPAPRATSPAAATPSAAPAATPSTASAATPSTAPAATPSAASAAPTGAARAAAVLEQCARVARLGEAALEASRQGQRDWADHVGSYRDLVDGRVPYAEAQRTWARTRAAGAAELFRFATAERRWLDVQGTCTGTAGLPPSEQAPARACADRVAATGAALADARVVLGQWHAHQRDMRAADRGDLDRATAQARFRRLVREAPGALEAARAGAARLRAAPACADPA